MQAVCDYNNGSNYGRDYDRDDNHDYNYTYTNRKMTGGPVISKVRLFVKYFLKLNTDHRL